MQRLSHVMGRGLDPDRVCILIHVRLSQRRTSRVPHHLRSPYVRVQAAPGIRFQILLWCQTVIAAGLQLTKWVGFWSLMLFG